MHIFWASAHIFPQAEVVAVGGWLDVVLTLQKPHLFANQSVFSNVHDLLLVLPPWLVRRTQGGWQYWLQRINVSEQEVCIWLCYSLRQNLYAHAPTTKIMFLHHHVIL